MRSSIEKGIYLSIYATNAKLIGGKGGKIS